MSDVHTDPLSLPEPGFSPPEPASWRVRLADLAESLDLSARRLVVGVLALVAVAVLAWRALAPPATAAEMGIPFTDRASAAASPAGSLPSGGTLAPGGSSPSASPAAASGAAGGPGGAAASGPGGPPGPAAGAASGEATEVVVHVAGAVGRPGVRRLPAGARAGDAVEAAGGAAPDADLARVNLAAAVQDGQQLYVPRVGEVPPVPAPVPGGSGAGGPAAGAAAGDPAAVPVDVNTATADQLDTLPGVGPATAAAIIAHRQENGPFASVEDLLDVRGIGEAKLEQLRPLVAL